VIDEREYSIDFRNEPPRSYLVGETYVRSTTDYRRSMLGQDMFDDLRGLIGAERSLIDETDSVEYRKVYTAVARSLSYIARRAVTYWEQAAVTHQAPDTRELLEIEKNYYRSLLSHFDDAAITSIGTVGSLSVEAFYRDVAKAPEQDVNLQVRYANRMTTILRGFANKYVPAIDGRLAGIDAELAPPRLGNPAPR
jgi:hypothetical protein